MKLNNFELVIELREFLRDYTPMSYLTNYALIDKVPLIKQYNGISVQESIESVGVNDFTEMKELDCVKQINAKKDLKPHEVRDGSSGTENE